MSEPRLLVLERTPEALPDFPDVRVRMQGLAEDPSSMADVYDETVAVVLLGRSDQGVAEDEIDALRRHTRPALPQFVILCCPSLEDSERTRLITYVQDLLKSEGIAATVLPGDDDNPLGFWPLLPIAHRLDLISGARTRTERETRERAGAAAREEVARLTDSLQAYAKVRLECDAIAQLHARRREAIERCRKSAFDEINTTSLVGRAIAKIDEAARNSVSGDADLAKHLEQVLSRFLETWSQSVLEDFLDGIARDAEVILAVPHDAASPNVAIETRASTEPKLDKIIRYGGSGLSVVGVAALLGVTAPLVILPAAALLTYYMFRSGASDEKRRQLLQDASPQVSEACARYLVFLRDLISRLCTQAEQQLRQAETVLQAKQLALPGAMSDDEALALSAQRLSLLGS